MQRGLGERASGEAPPSSRRTRISKSEQTSWVAAFHKELFRATAARGHGHSLSGKPRGLSYEVKVHRAPKIDSWTHSAAPSPGPPPWPLTFLRQALLGRGPRPPQMPTVFIFLQSSLTTCLLPPLTLPPACELLAGVGEGALVCP